MPALLEIAAAGGVDLRGAVTRRFTLDEAGEAYTLLQQRKIVGRALICFP
jgi:succinate semialdehyde reductase (NADPH)